MLESDVKMIVVLGGTGYRCMFDEGTYTIYKRLGIVDVNNERHQRHEHIQWDPM